MSEQTAIPVQAIIDRLVARIGQLELENAVLRAQLEPPPVQATPNGDNAEALVP